MQYDVIILGAGLAGLAAAGRLVDAERRLLLLEARDRIGGALVSGYRAASEILQA